MTNSTFGFNFLTGVEFPVICAIHSNVCDTVIDGLYRRCLPILKHSLTFFFSRIYAKALLTRGEVARLRELFLR